MEDSSSEKPTSNIYLHFREKEVLKLLAQNKTYHEVAEEMMLVRQSVYTIVKNMKLKFGVHYKDELVNYAKAHQLI